MVRLRLASLLKERGWTAYELAKETERRPGLTLTMSRAYRLAGEDGRFSRIEEAVLDRLCEVLDTTPGDLLEYRPTRPVKRRR